MYLRRALTTAAAVLLLAACSEDPEPVLTEPTVTSTPSSPSTSSVRPPEPWEERSTRGAVAFVRHWLIEFNVAANTGSTDVLANLGTKRCQTCNNFVAYIRAIYKGGGTYEAKAWTPIATAPVPGLSADEAVVNFRVRQPPERIERPGQPIERNKRDFATYTASLVWIDKQWVMDRLVLQQ